MKKTLTSEASETLVMACTDPWCTYVEEISTEELEKYTTINKHGKKYRLCPGCDTWSLCIDQEGKQTQINKFYDISKFVYLACKYCDWARRIPEDLWEENKIISSFDEEEKGECPHCGQETVINNEQLFIMNRNRKPRITINYI